MKNAVAIMLIVVGGCLVLGPVLTNAYTTNREKERIAEFYTRNGNGAPLPEVMQPSGHTVYDWACLIAGVAVAAAGATKSRSASEVQSSRERQALPDPLTR